MNSVINEIPLLFNSYLRRKPFMDVCFFFYKKHLPNVKIYLTLDNDNYDVKGLNIDILTYDDIPTTSTVMHECHSWYYRHYFTLNYLKSLGHKYSINCMDDGWVGNVSWEEFNKMVDYIEEHNADRIDLCGPQPNYELKHINNNLYYVNPENSLPWYLTNQCSMWKIDSLLKIYETIGPVADPAIELYGSEVARRLNYKFLTFPFSLFNNSGVFTRTVGIDNRGLELLKQYCEENNFNYNEKLNEFNQFI